MRVLQERQERKYGIDCTACNDTLLLEETKISKSSRGKYRKDLDFGTKDG